MKKYFLMIAIALIAIGTNLNSQNAQNTNAPKKDAPKPSGCQMTNKSSCKMDSSKCSMWINKNKTDSTKAPCNQNTGKCSQKKNCPMKK